MKRKLEPRGWEGGDDGADGVERYSTGDKASTGYKE